MALLGTGLGRRSPDSKSYEGISLRFDSCAAAWSPEKNSSNMRTSSGVTQWEATLIVPTAPTASSANVSASSPL